MTTCLTSLGEGIAAGMQMLAMALSQNQAPAPHHPGPAFPVTQAQPNMYPGHYSGYVQHNHQFTSSTSTRNQSSLPTTHGAVSAANQTLYDFGDDGSMYNSRSWGKLCTIWLFFVEFTRVFDNGFLSTVKQIIQWKAKPCHNHYMFQLRMYAISIIMQFKL